MAAQLKFHVFPSYSVILGLQPLLPYHWNSALPMCAAKEELVLAALRIEALQVAKNISQCPSLSTVTPQVLRWVSLHLLYASVCVGEQVCLQEQKMHLEWGISETQVCVKCTCAWLCVCVCAWVCLSLPLPPLKHTILSVTVNPWPYQHGGCTAASTVPPPSASPHWTLTWLDASQLPPWLPASSIKP